jgi:hypothetical protein
VGVFDAAGLPGVSEVPDGLGFQIVRCGEKTQVVVAKGGHGPALSIEEGIEVHGHLGQLRHESAAFFVLKARELALGHARNPALPGCVHPLATSKNVYRPGVCGFLPSVS